MFSTHFIQAVYKAYLNEKNMLFAVLWQEAKLLVPYVKYEPLCLLQQRS